MTYYCVQCKRATAPYDLWPDHTCDMCHTSFEKALDIDALH